MPGRKTDVQDAEWIADLLRHGLLKASFVPDRPQRELRELTRYRTSFKDVIEQIPALKSMGRRVDAGGVYSSKLDR
ncbi:MAG: hypothetical protein NVSMB38_45970 [Ktedonobacteraceae bacterium]